MATTSKRLFGPAQLTNAAATLYTAPAATVAVARRMRVSNPTINPINITLSIGADAAGTRLYDNVAGPPCGSLDLYRPFTLAATKFFQGFASDNAELVLKIDGTETA